MAEEREIIRINELARFTIFSENTNQSGKKARLAWAVRDNNPRITVYINDNNLRGAEGIINAPMNPETFLCFLTLLEKITKNSTADSYSIECYNTPWVDGKPTENKVLVCTVIAGKNDQGITYIDIIPVNKPKFRFIITISDYHKIFKGDKTPFTASEASTLQTLSLVSALRDIFVSFSNGFRRTQSTGPTKLQYSSNPSANNTSGNMDDLLNDIPF